MEDWLGGEENREVERGEEEDEGDESDESDKGDEGDEGDEDEEDDGDDEEDEEDDDEEDDEEDDGEDGEDGEDDGENEGEDGENEGEDNNSPATGAHCIVLAVIGLVRLVVQTDGVELGQGLGDACHDVVVICGASRIVATGPGTGWIIKLVRIFCELTFPLLSKKKDNEKRYVKKRTVTYTRHPTSNRR